MVFKLVTSGYITVCANQVTVHTIFSCLRSAILFLQLIMGWFEVGFVLFGGLGFFFCFVLCYKDAHEGLLRKIFAPCSSLFCLRLCTHHKHEKQP